jgi:hypothetical protein
MTPTRVWLLALLAAAVDVHGQEAPRQLYPIRDPRTRTAGYIDRSGQVVVEPQFDSADAFHDGLGAVRLGSRWGFVNAEGRLVVEPRYDQVSPFYEGIAAVGTTRNWGFIDASGKELTAQRFPWVRPFSDGMAWVWADPKSGFLDRNGQMAIEPTFDGIGSFTEGLAPATKDERWGFIDETGQFVIPPEYYWVDNFSEGLALVEAGPGREGYIDHSGKLAIARRFWNALPFSNGLAAVVPEPGAAFGLIDKTGKVVVEPKFEEVALFSEGLAAVRIGFLWGYIDTTGTVVLEPKYQRADTFSGGLARVSLEGKYVYIDREGRTVWEPPPVDPNAPPPPPRPAPPAPPAPPPPAPTPLGGVGAESVSVVGNPNRARFPDDGPNVFSRSVWDLMLYDGRIYVGGGDYWDNTGPVDIYSFSPVEGDMRLEYTAPDEMVSRMYVFDGRLVVPGNDPKESWDLGNLYIKEAGEWREVRTLPNVLHCFGLAYTDGVLLASTSGEHQPKLLRSTNWGATWEPVLYHEFPTVIFAHQGKLCGMRGTGPSCLEGDVLVPKWFFTKWETLARPWGALWPWFGQTAVPFGEGVLFLGALQSAGPEQGPSVPWALATPTSDLTEVEALKGECVMDAIVRGEMLFAVMTRKLPEGYENLVVGTSDLKSWWPVLSFNSEAYAVSLEETGGRFYVGLGCGYQTKRGTPAPKAAGDIVCVLPKPGKMSPP